MSNMKRVFKCTFLTFIIFITFSSGMFFGYYFIPPALTVNYFNSKIKRQFGMMTQYSDYKVIGGIHWKDISFPMIIKNGVKTIRAYKFLQSN